MAPNSPNSNWLKSVDQSGIIRIALRKNTSITRGVIAEFLADCATIELANQFPCLWDLRLCTTTERDALDLLATASLGFRAMAILVRSDAPSITALIPMELRQIRNPTRLFYHEQEALDWLIQLQKSTAQEEAKSNYSSSFCQMSPDIYKWQAPEVETLASISFLFNTLEALVRVKKTPYVLIIDTTSSTPPSRVVRKQIKQRFRALPHKPLHTVFCTNSNPITIVIKHIIEYSLRSEISIVPEVGGALPLAEAILNQKLAEQKSATKINAKTKNFTFRYGLAGFLFGIFFPALAYFYLNIAIREGGSFLDIVAAHQMFPLFWIIDLAPLVLGTYGTMLGAKERARRLTQDRINTIIAEQALMLDSTQDAARIGTFRYDANHNEISASRQTYSILNHPFSLRLTWAKFQDCFADDSQEDVAAKIALCLNEGSDQEMQYKLSDKDGKFRWLRILIKAIWQDKAIIGLHGSIQDITRIRTAELSVQHIAKLASIGELAAGIGHEINNPLMVAQANLKNLHNHLPQDPVAIRLQNKIDEALKTIETVVSALRTYSRSEKQELKAIDVNQSITGAVAMVQDYMAGEGVTIALDLGPEVFINATNVKIQQILINLLDNARDAIVESADGSQILITTRRKGDRLELIVADNGAGISPEVEKQIFNAFFTTKPEGQGTGLGLSLVANIVYELNGSISLQTELGVGTAFLIGLPLTSAPLEKSGEAVSVPTNFDYNVLIIDDQEGVRAVLKDFLEDMGCTTTEAADGLQGLAAATTGNFDLIITDVRMPNCDGPTFAARLRDNPEQLARIPKIVFATGGIKSSRSTDFSDLEKLADGILFKPFDQEALAAIIDDVMAEALPKSA